MLYCDCEHEILVKNILQNHHSMKQEWDYTSIGVLGDSVTLDGDYTLEELTILVEILTAIQDQHSPSSS